MNPTLKDSQISVGSNASQYTVQEKDQENVTRPQDLKASNAAKSVFSTRNVSHTENFSFRAAQVLSPVVAIVAASVAILAASVVFVAGIIPALGYGAFKLYQEVSKSGVENVFRDLTTPQAKQAELKRLNAVLVSHKNKIEGVISSSSSVDFSENIKSQSKIRLLSLVCAYEKCMQSAMLRSNGFFEIEQSYFGKIDEEIKIISDYFKDSNNLNESEKVKKFEKALVRIERLYKKCAIECCGVDGDQFKEAYHRERGRLSPEELTHKISDGLTETTKKLSNKVSLDYLQQRDKPHESGKANIYYVLDQQYYVLDQQIKRERIKLGLSPLPMTEYNPGISPHPVPIDDLSERSYTEQIKCLKDYNGIRFSPLKDQNDMQGMTINGHKHSITETGVENGKKSSVFRSGAFAVHGRANARSIDCENKIKAATEKETINELEMKKKGIKKTKNMGIYALKKKMAALERKLLELDTSSNASLSNLSLAPLKEALNKPSNEAFSTLASTFKPPLSKEELKPYVKIHKELLGLGFQSMDEFRKELSFRRDLAISQALPEIVESLSDIVSDPRIGSDPSALQMALAAGRFSYFKEGLLSHMDAKEAGMMEDMKGALDYLSENCTICLDGTESTPTIDVDSKDPLNPKIVIHLFKPGGVGLEDVESKKQYKLSAICFNTAVNEMHTLGRFLGSTLTSAVNIMKTTFSVGKEALQDEMNAEGLNQCYEIYTSIPDKNKTDGIKKTWEALEKHYTTEGKRSSSDMEGMRLRRKFYKAIGANCGFACKSGKDRTGGCVSEILADDIYSGRPDKKKELKKSLLGGNSYLITGSNTGKANAYAFSDMQRPFIPEEIRPPASLCGKRES